jgi:long-chain acyl-CoA synthetase
MCTSGNYVARLIKLKEDGTGGKLENIISFEKLVPEEIEKAEKAGLKLHYFWDVVERGSKMTASFNEPEPDSVYMFCYTSGTTGDPKAAMLTHRNFISATTASYLLIDNMGENDVMISYLPMAHSMEKYLFFACIQFGI